jgi:serine palmitoyltransferase
MNSAAAVVEGNPLYDSILQAYEVVKSTNYSQVQDLVWNGPIYYREWWTNLYREAPVHVIIETSLIVFILWLTFFRRTVDPQKTSKNPKLSKAETEMLIREWEPEPLVPELSEKSASILNSMKVVEDVQGLYMTIRGIKKPVLNMSSFDFLGLGSDPSLKTAASNALDKYGCGSCGPRGFYGTIDQHLMIERAVADYMGTDEAISYSDGASTVSSAIQAFCKRGDLLIVDEACCEQVLMGVNLSRSVVKFFKHNDMKHLEAILTSVAADDKRLKRDGTSQRRFIITEGLYRNCGDLCPLPEILDLKEKFCYRLLMDESVSFGAVGKTGKGVTEHYGIPITAVEIITIAMDTVLGSIGGLCIGSRDIVEHQRLSGAGYCFSASACPFLSAVALEALGIMSKSDSPMKALHANTQTLYKALKSVPKMEVVSDEPSAVIHLRIKSDFAYSNEDECTLIQAIASECVNRGVGVVASKFQLTHPQAAKAEMKPTIRVCANAAHDAAMIATTVSEIKNAASSLLR